MVNSSCGTLAVGSDKPASDQSHSPRRAGHHESLRVVGRQSSRRTGCPAARDRAAVPSHRASTRDRRARAERKAPWRASRSSRPGSLLSLLPRPVRSRRGRDSRALAYQPRVRPARVSVAAPNPALEPTGLRGAAHRERLRAGGSAPISAVGAPMIDRHRRDVLRTHRPDSAGRNNRRRTLNPRSRSAAAVVRSWTLAQAEGDCDGPSRRWVRLRSRSSWVRGNGNW
jgi:hypothetical protein